VKVNGVPHPAPVDTRRLLSDHLRHDVLSVVGLLNEHPNPTAEQIDEGISGNLCRCTGYASIRRAVKRAAELTPSPRRGEGRGEGRAVEGPSG
jgi:aerobic-type carbon monoxide dehydrogenase small subunit (CoxS/CutS family)